MQVLYPRCAGLDVHKDTIVACVRCVSPPMHQEVRSFGSTTTELLALAEQRQGTYTFRCSIVRHRAGRTPAHEAGLRAREDGVVVVGCPWALLRRSASPWCREPVQ